MSESRDSDLAGPADPTIVLSSERAERDGTLVARHLRHVSQSPGVAVAKEWAPGDRIGPYRIEGLLGRGGMGVVYRAVHMGLDRPVALKRIHLSEGSSGWTREDALRRFHREAQTLAALDHPLLVKVYDVGEHEGEPYLAMEYVEGPSLEELLRTHALPLEENVRILRMAAEGIGHAHGRGIVHRDLKPSNILVERSTGKARVLDFGLAAADRSREARLTRTGEIMGTVDYMAPEQVEATGGEARPPVDVYALGVVLYEALTGSTPFAGASPVDILSRRLTEDPLAPRWIAPAVPRDLDAICLKCLERSPARRYPEAGALAADLERWLGGQPVLAAPPSRLRRGARFLKKHWKGATVLALVLASGVAVGYGLWSSHLARERADQERRAQVQSAATTLARNIETLLAQGQASAETLARIVEMFPDPALHEEEIKDFIHRMLVDRPRVYGSCVAFEPDAFRTGEKHYMSYGHRDLADSGRIKFPALDYSIYDYFSMEWYSETRRRVEVYWTRAYFDKDAGNVLMVTCSAPFYRDAGRLFERGAPEREELGARFRGVATVDVALDHIHAEMNALAVGKTGYCLLVERDGRILTFPERDGFPPFGEVELEKEFAEIYPGADLADILAEAGESSAGAVRQARCPCLRKEAYFAVLALRGTGWRLVTVYPVDEVTGESVPIGPR